MMMKGWKHVLLAGSIIFILPATGPAGDTVVLGVATSLTTLEGRESFNGVALAVDEINARGGVRIGAKTVPFQIESIDLQDASPDVRVADAVRDLEHFILKKNLAALVVGPFRSEVLLSGMDMIARHKVPLLGSIAMSPASDAKIMRNPEHRFIFRVCLNSKYLADYLINTMKFLHQRFGFNKVYIMNQDVAWARTTTSLVIRLFFEKAGWDILGLDVYPSGASNFSSSLEKASSKGAQVILPIFDMPQSGALVKQWNTMRVPALLCGFISPMVGPGAWQAFDGKIANALNVIFELGNVPSAKYLPAKAFYEAYKRKYGREIEAGHGPAPAYESVYVLAEAIERAGSLDSDKVVRALEKTDRVGVMGRIRFHPGHQVIFGKDPSQEALACVFQWTTDGKRKIVYPPSIAEGEVELPVFSR